MNQEERSLQRDEDRKRKWDLKNRTYGDIYFLNKDGFIVQFICLSMYECLRLPLCVGFMASTSCPHVSLYKFLQLPS